MSDIQELESLGNITTSASNHVDNEVTSAGKKSQRVMETAAAIYVITPEDIRRSGVTHIAEALRLAPGVQVARTGANRWAISARGLTSTYANKLLVLIDGREVYSPSFGGVYWDVQDLPLETVQRIEVIRGPGASLWGANAVNGVINIITYSAKDTLGGNLRAGGGNLVQGYGSLRYGAKLGDQTYGRVYAKGANRSSFELAGGGDAKDRWGNTRAGFRVDSETGANDSLMLQGDAFQTDFEQYYGVPSLTLSPPYNPYVRSKGQASGFNLLGRWRRALSLSSEVSLQGYFDHSYRQELFAAQEIDTFDLEFQHRFRWGGRQDVTWGLGYRLVTDRIGNSPYFNMRPNTVNRQLFSGFFQDDISLIEQTLNLTIGAKLQHNDYTGFEGQPSLRLAWTPNQNHTVWGGISRAVRTPTRLECCASSLFAVIPPDGFPILPAALMVSTRPNADFKAERVWSYELGYRFRPNSRFSADLALFYSRYSGLLGYRFPQTASSYRNGLLAALYSENLLSGDVYGAELSLDWRPLSWMGLEAGYTYLHSGIALPANTLGFTSNDPSHQAYLRSSFNLTPQWDLDFWLRYVDYLPGNASTMPTGDSIPGYLSMDARLAWRPLPTLEFSVVGQNLLSPRHQEFTPVGFGSPPTSVPRSGYLQMNWQF